MTAECDKPQNVGWTFLSDHISQARPHFDGQECPSYKIVYIIQSFVDPLKSSLPC